MAKYLDPKADLTFKKVFGEHPDLAVEQIAKATGLTVEEVVSS